jgi:5'-nucleotidase
LNILVTNDDGIESGSLPVLLKSLRSVRNGKRPARIFTLVPDREQSGASHSITLTRPLRITRIRQDLYTLDGTPTDCVNAVLLGGLPFGHVDLVVSGINRGPNLSEDVFYSGTVAGAREGALFGIPALAVSLVTGRKDPDWSFAARFVTSFIRGRAWKSGDFFNINIPDLPPSRIKGVKATSLGNRKYNDVLLKRKDPWGNAYFWLQGKGITWSRKEGTDYFEVKRGFVSVTPLGLDLTDHDKIGRLRSQIDRRNDA